jgi:hypothetical protein
MVRLPSGPFWARGVEQSFLGFRVSFKNPLETRMTGYVSRVHNIFRNPRFEHAKGVAWILEGFF